MSDQSSSLSELEKVARRIEQADDVYREALSALKQVTAKEEKEHQALMQCRDALLGYVTTHNVADDSVIAKALKVAQSALATAQNVVTDWPHQPAVPNIDTQRLDQLESRMKIWESSRSRKGITVGVEERLPHGSLREAIDAEFGNPSLQSAPNNPPGAGRASAEGETVAVGPCPREEEKNL